MSPIDALYQAVHAYPGGAPALAPRMGIAASTLLSYANPNCDSHRWPLMRALQVPALTGNMGPVAAICALFGGVFVALGEMAAVGDVRVLRQMQRLASEFGDVPRELENILADGRVTSRELAQFRLQITELQQAAAAMAMIIERIADSGEILPEAERPE